MIRFAWIFPVAVIELIAFTWGDGSLGASPPGAPPPKRVPAGEIEGRILDVNSSRRALRVQIRVPYLKGRNLAYRDVDLTLQAADDVKVRVPTPPLYDDKGQPRKYTSQELKALRGPGRLPGFPGDFDSLHHNQMVHVILERPAADSGNRRARADETNATSSAQTVAAVVVVLTEPVH